MKKNCNDECVNILWTGGWDSTFRIIQVSKEGRTVQPYYVIDTGRPSALKEIKQMQKIKSALCSKYPRCNIKNTVYISLDSMVVEDKYKIAYKNLRSKSFMGSQYVWIGSLSKKVNNLELCIHKNDKAEFFINKMHQNRSLKKKKDSDEELLFGDLNFPILEYTKLSMKEECAQGGDLDILNMSWFCFTPINDTPCGLCNPCKYSLNEGMKTRFTTRARLYSKAPLVFKKLRKISRKFF